MSTRNIDPHAKLKDEIARNNFGKAYARMAAAEQAIIDHLAAQIAPSLPPSVPSSAAVAVVATPVEPLGVEERVIQSIARYDWRPRELMRDAMLRAIAAGAPIEHIPLLKATLDIMHIDHERDLDRKMKIVTDKVDAAWREVMKFMQESQAKRRRIKR